MNLHVEERNGAVILTLEDQYALMPPDQAEEIGKELVKMAHYARTGSTPDSREAIAERIKTKLVTRLSLVIKNLQDSNRKPLYIANEVVNIVLSEAL